MTIITAIEQARRAAKRAFFPSTKGEAFFAVEQALPKLHTVTVNQTTARRIAAALIADCVSFAVEPDGQKVMIAVKQEAAHQLDALWQDAHALKGT